MNVLNNHHPTTRSDSVSYTPHRLQAKALEHDEHCVIYTRFSPRRNAAECESCQLQEQHCQEYARAHGWTVRASFDDEDASGKDEYRQKLWDAVDALRRGDVLLVAKRDRLARNVYLSEQINRAVTKRGGRIVAVSGDVEGDGPEIQMIRQVLAAIAEYERKLIASRTSHAMKAYMKQGRRMGGKVPVGWKVNPSDPGRMVEVPEEREAINVIGKLAIAGASIRAILKTLNLQYPRPSGEPWSYSTVQRLRKKVAPNL